MGVPGATYEEAATVPKSLNFDIVPADVPMFASEGPQQFVMIFKVVELTTCLRSIFNSLIFGWIMYKERNTESMYSTLVAEEIVKLKIVLAELAIVFAAGTTY